MPTTKPKIFLGCIMCKHYMPDGTCAAFPEGIPFSITSGAIDHLEPLKGQQNQVVFEQASKAFVNFK